MYAKSLLRDRIERFITLVEQDAPDNLRLNELGLISQACGMVMGSIMGPEGRGISTMSLEEAQTFRLPSAKDRNGALNENG